MSELNRQLQGLGERRGGDLPPLSATLVPKVRTYPWRGLLLFGGTLALSAVAFGVWQKLPQDDLATQTKGILPIVSQNLTTSPSEVPSQVASVLTQLAQSATDVVKDTSQKWQQAVESKAPLKTTSVPKPPVDTPSLIEPKAVASNKVTEPPEIALKAPLTASARLNIEEKTVSSAQLAERFRRQGEQFWRKGDAVNAITAFEQSLQQSPTQIAVRQRLAAIHYGRGDIWVAERILLAGFVEEGDNLDLRWTLAKLWGQEKQFKKALSYVLPEPQEAPSRYWLLRGQLAQRCENYPIALRSFRYLTERFPQLDTGWLGLAIESERVGQLSVAETAYRRVLKSKSVSASSLTFAKERLRLMEITS